MNVYFLDLNYEGKAGEKQTIEYFECGNRKNVRYALSQFREKYPDYKLCNPVSDVLHGGVYGFVNGKVVCVVC